MVVIFASLVLLQQANPPAPSKAPSYDKPNDRLVALIDGAWPIYLSDLEREARLEGRLQPGETLDPASAETRRLLTEVINQNLLARHAQRMGVGKSREARERIQAARTRILASIFLEARVSDAVTPEAVREIYDQQQALLKLGDEVRARHILLAEEAEAKDVFAKVEAGESFEDLARARSMDPSTRMSGGDLGYFGAETMAEEISAAAFRTAVGDIAPPFRSEFGWHVLKVEDRRAARPPAYETLEPDISRFLTLEVVEDVIKEIRRGVDIELFDIAEQIGGGEPEEEPEAGDVSAADGADEPEKAEE